MQKFSSRKLLGNTVGWVSSNPATGAATNPHLGLLPSRHGSTRRPLVSSYQAGKPYSLFTGPAVFSPTGTGLSRTAAVASALVAAASGRATTAVAAFRRRVQRRCCLGVEGAGGVPPRRSMRASDAPEWPGTVARVATG
ncbi:MAG: hypothetical protein JWR35_3756 [Marmoricola sp.]|nr:hypothetical protein [Marmoricola sp.]